MRIAERYVVAFHYTLTNDAGEVIDSSAGRDPLTYLHGKGHIVAGLEKRLTGCVVGDKFEVKVSPEEGYGVRHEELLKHVPQEMFEGVENLEMGMQFEAHGPHGVMPVRVVGFDGGEVIVDANHPLAGENLNFSIEVMDVREASMEEVLHGHVHGPGGHHH